MSKLNFFCKGFNGDRAGGDITPKIGNSTIQSCNFPRFKSCCVMAEFIIQLVEHNYNHYLQTYKALLNWSPAPRCRPIDLLLSPKLRETSPMDPIRLRHRLGSMKPSSSFSLKISSLQFCNICIYKFVKFACQVCKILLSHVSTLGRSLNRGMQRSLDRS